MLQSKLKVYRNVFILGLDGESVHVETLVMQMFASDYADEDETVFVPNTDGTSEDGRNDAAPSGYIKSIRGGSSVDNPPQYTGGRWKGWHCEGSILRSLFGILMWDVFFQDVPNVFYTPYQDQPLDLLYGRAFYENRYV
jgi:hypothetical protein